jgi:broad specificity phosphatase PhoE
VVKKDWPDVDFSHLDPVYPQKTGIYEASEEAFQSRAALANRWLLERPEKCVVVVTHSGFLKRIVGGPKFQNVEYRTYRFAEDDSGELKLREFSQDKPLEQQ